MLVTSILLYHLRWKRLRGNAMSRRPPEISIPVAEVNRHFPPEVVKQTAKTLEASGVVDYVQLWDQLVSWYPRVLWTPENTPAAKVVKDIDSYWDPYVMSAYAVSDSPNIGVQLTTDAIRRGPGEFQYMVQTLATITNGRAQFHMGAGELKQCKPFGWKRSEGLSRLEDHLRAFRMFYEHEEPFDFEGNHWKLKDAWIGYAKAPRPQHWVVGGGPKITDLATSYADGFSTITPWVLPTPEQYADHVTAWKEILERKGRDPEQFGFGIWCCVMLHEDEGRIDAALDNTMIRWNAATIGRLNQADWEREGITPAMPVDWHYAMKLLPVTMSLQEANEIVGRTTHAMADKSFVTGTPEKVAAFIQQYVDAGATWVSVNDFMPLALEPEEAMQAGGRAIEVARILKGITGSAVSAPTVSSATAG
jgi:phthiodiolone/phenolphthiodiolone dimycocerosates ketoreductase